MVAPPNKSSSVATVPVWVARPKVWPDAGSARCYALWRPIFAELVVRRHVIAQCRVLPVAGGAHMRGDALSDIEDFDGAVSDRHRTQIPIERPAPINRNKHQIDVRSAPRQRIE